MQATAIGTVAVTIVLLGSFLYTRALMSHVGSQFLDQIEVSVYLSSADTAAQIGELRSRLAADPRIAQATFVPKKDGLRELRERMKGQIDLSILTENPLPDKFRVRVLSPADVAPVASEIRKWPGVDSVNYGQDLVARLLQLSKVMNNVGVAVIGLFILVAAIIISNTIRLTVFARRREI
ncbi:MAG: ABC transporter permease, partial [Candidatus Eremiobacteraeota bacterium]|nr:ABC transporter permease [Candidatus Eremiobacteraeota bacterium]